MGVSEGVSSLVHHNIDLPHRSSVAIMSQVQLVVRQRSTNLSITVNLTQASQQVVGGDDEVDAGLIQATGAACVGSISSLAQTDTRFPSVAVLHALTCVL